MPEIVPKSVQKCLKIVLGYLFSKKSFAHCSMEGRVFENFQKIKKFSKLQKCPKSFPKVSKRVLNMFWGNFFETKFLPSVPWRVESSKIFQKFKKISKFQNCPKLFPKVSKRVLNKLWGIFFEKKIFPVLHEGSGLRKLSEKSDHAKLVRLPTKRYVKCWMKNYFLENIKINYYDNTVISFTKEAVSCECHH